MVFELQIKNNTDHRELSLDVKGLMLLACESIVRIEIKSSIESICFYFPDSGNFGWNESGFFSFSPEEDDESFFSKVSINFEMFGVFT